MEFGSGGGQACEIQLGTLHSLSMAAISMREHVPSLRSASTFRLEESALHSRKLQFDSRAHVYGRVTRVCGCCWRLWHVSVLLLAPSI